MASRPQGRFGLLSIFSVKKAFREHYFLSSRMSGDMSGCMDEWKDE